MTKLESKLWASKFDVKLFKGTYNYIFALGAAESFNFNIISCWYCDNKFDKLMYTFVKVNDDLFFDAESFYSGKEITEKVQNCKVFCLDRKKSRELFKEKKTYNSNIELKRIVREWLNNHKLVLKVNDESGILRLYSYALRVNDTMNKVHLLHAVVEKGKGYEELKFIHRRSFLNFDNLKILESSFISKDNFY